MSDITSANSKLRIVVPAYYPTGFYVEDYAADSMFETASRQNKEDLMTADGNYHAGYIFNPSEFTITLSPASNTGLLLDNWTAAEETAIGAFVCNATLTVPSLGAKWNLVNGYLISWVPTPPGRRILQPRAAVFRFKSALRSSI
ncbi:phage tail fiber protein [Escherichia coli]